MSREPVANQNRMPRTHSEVSDMEVTPGEATLLIQDRLAEKNLLPYFNSHSSEEAKSAVSSQFDKPLDEQHHRKSQVELTADRKVRFLTFLAKFGLRMRAAQYAGVSYATALNHRKSDQLFGEAWDEAMEIFGESLENEALKRAIDGWDEPVYQKGELVGTIHRYSERMMELLLKANLPTKYRENVKLDANVTGGVLVVPAAVDADKWQEQYGAPTVIDHEPGAK